MHTHRTSTARLRLNVWVIAALVTMASPLAMQSEMHTAARANSYDDGWQENWVAHARAVLAGTQKSNGFVLQVGDSMTHTMAVSSWPRGPAGATAEDLATLNWSRSSSWSTSHVDVTQKNGWYLAGADTTGWRGMTASGGLS